MIYVIKLKNGHDKFFVSTTKIGLKSLKKLLNIE